MWREGETDNEYRTLEAGAGWVCVLWTARQGDHEPGRTQIHKTKKKEKKGRGEILLITGCCSPGITSRCSRQLDCSVLVFMFCSRLIFRVSVCCFMHILEYRIKKWGRERQTFGGKILYNCFYARLRWFLTYAKRVDAQIKRLKLLC